MSLLTGLKQKLEKGIESTSQRSKKVLDISRITLLIRNLKENEEELHRRLGQEIYRYWSLKGQLEMTDLTRATIRQVEEIREKIDELEKTLEELKKNDPEPEPKKQEWVKGEPTAEAVPPPAIAPSGEGEKSPSASETPSLTGPQQEATPETDDWAEGQAIFFCPHCGNQVDEETVTCSHCQKSIYD